MEYHGKLYGKVGSEYFPLLNTTVDWNTMEVKIQSLETELAQLKAQPAYNPQKPVIATEVMKDVNELRETLDMIEWCLSGKSKNVQLYITDLPLRLNGILRHFR